MTRSTIAFYVLVVGLCVPSSVLAQNDRFGVVTSVLDPDHGAKVTELGAGSVRLDFFWSDVEPSQDNYQWTDVDRFMQEARNRNLKIFVSLSMTPSWAGPCESCMPYNLGDWYDFVWRVIHRYTVLNNYNVVFGVWNEPNLHFLDDDAYASQYKLLFEYADAARDSVNPGARLAGPETSHHAITDNSYFSFAMTKIRPYLTEHDKITVHWYPDGPNLSSMMQHVNLYSEGQEVWLTETGIETCDDGAQVSHLVGVLDAFQNLASSPWTRMFYFVLYDGLPCSALINPGWQPRPAFYYYRDYIAAYGGGASMQPNSAVGGCSNWTWWSPTYQPNAAACGTYCSQNNADACEWYQNGDCYVEFGGACYLESGNWGWSAAVYGSGGGGSQMQPDSAIVGCSNWSWWSPVYQPDAESCYSYCVQNNGDACEWYQNGDCYVEFGNGCSIQSGYSGWSAAVVE